MPVYEFASDEIRRLDHTTFSSAQMQERRDLQRLLRANIGVIAAGTLVIAEEFGHWDDSRRRIDLLGIDKDAKLVVIELKRTEDGGHIELQAIRYAAMISTMTFDQAVGVYETYLEQIGQLDVDARTGMLEFLGWEEPDEDAFGQDVRIVLASAEFSREVTTSVLWLIDRGIDIRCVRLQPYDLGGRVLVDVQQIIPLPEVAEYQVRVAEKKRKEREARTDTRDWTSYDLSVGTATFTGLRKRHVIYQVFRALVARGIDPETIAAQCGARASRALMSVEGNVDGEGFYELARQARLEEGKTFDPKRYFSDEGELVHLGERTYAFSSQWGGDAWLQAMNRLKDAFPEADIRFNPALAT
ncbi:hypothetical protein [Falsirhodobacter halotolerans]|uniref:hypothetical protein n=1 Tax=Falsirhodobacter halotolerans TaxID=1146892 RepID=UPI001FD22D13|nr:hypothetical protein [Falsirhodobacter halotolerans]MCJ8140080.1 hypothetical protein [Falsirhodobacter halotolerans]